jgi:hypothetical protein
VFPNDKLIIKIVSKWKQWKEMEKGNERKEKLGKEEVRYLVKYNKLQRTLLRSIREKTSADLCSESRRRGIFCTKYDTNYMYKHWEE